MNDASPPYGSKQNMAQLINVGETDEGTGIQARTRSPHRGWVKTNSPAMDTTDVACGTEAPRYRDAACDTFSAATPISPCDADAISRSRARGGRLSAREPCFVPAPAALRSAGATMKLNASCTRSCTDVRVPQLSFSPGPSTSGRRRVPTRGVVTGPRRSTSRN